MICLLYGYFCLWFERLCGHEIGEGMKHEEEEDSQDSHSDSNWFVLLSILVI